MSFPFLPDKPAWDREIAYNGKDEKKIRVVDPLLVGRASAIYDTL